MKKRVESAALDSTGLEDRQTSHHFRKRKDQTAKKPETSENQALPTHKKSSFPKLSILCDCTSHITLSFEADRGPWPDYEYFKPLLDRACKLAGIQRILGDAGYDSESNHCHARQAHQATAIMPATSGRPSQKLPQAKHRRRMKRLWEQYKKRYGQRWQVEATISMLKRMLGSALRARRHWTRCREILLRVITLNIMILGAIV